MGRSKMNDDLVFLGSIKAKIREFLYDTQLEEAEHMAELMGCSPISDDLFDREMSESELRVEKIKYLVPLAYALTTTLSDAFVRHEIAHDEEKAKDARQAALMKTLIMSTSFPAVVGALSQMVDLGVIKTVNPKKKPKGFKLW
jgi:hypothetical protein